MRLRAAVRQDIPAIAVIYNDEILNGTGTFDTQPRSDVEMKKWFDSHGEKHPIIVADEAGAVVGWASLSAWSERCAYARTAEVSVYVDKAARGKGLAGKLLDDLLRRGQTAGLAQVLARITEGNDVSVHLHAQRGFREVGLLKRVGEKFGRVMDVRILQKSFEAPI